MAPSYPPSAVSTIAMTCRIPIHGLVHPRKTRYLDILRNGTCNSRFLHENWSPLSQVSPSKKEASNMGYNRIGYAANKQASYSFQDDELDSVPFLSSLVKEAFRYFKSLIAFLVAQPGQLRYIEWPSFESTLKTATLTLVLVALLIVALSSVDAALWYLLAFILRRSA